MTETRTFINEVQSVEARFHLTSDNINRLETHNITSGQYGEGALHSAADGRRYCRVAWNVRSEGTYDVWVKYASAEVRPMRLSIGGDVRATNLLAESTGGWHRDQAIWRFQTRVQVTSADGLLALESDGPCPHLHCVMLAAADSTTEPPIETIDESVARLAKKFPAVLDRILASQVDAKSLVGMLIDPVKSAIMSGMSDQDVMGLVSGVCWAIRKDRADPQARIGFAGPLNGQRIRQNIFIQLSEIFAFDALVETGAYLGTTTEFFSSRGLPVYSCEAAPNYFYFSAMRLKDRMNARLFLEDSRVFLKRYFDNFSKLHSMPFFYLDAHWHEDLPLPYEIDLISDNQQDFVIMVDDFKSPFHPDYGYDRYSKGIELTLEYLRPVLKSKRKLTFAFPSMGPQAETGANAAH